MPSKSPHPDNPGASTPTAPAVNRLQTPLVLCRRLLPDVPTNRAVTGRYEALGFPVQMAMGVGRGAREPWAAVVGGVTEFPELPQVR
jgi:hypothetical protein